MNKPIFEQVLKFIEAQEQFELTVMKFMNENILDIVTETINNGGENIETDDTETYIHFTKTFNSEFYGSVVTINGLILDTSDGKVLYADTDDEMLISFNGISIKTQIDIVIYLLGEFKLSI